MSGSQWEALVRRSKSSEPWAAEMEWNQEISQIYFRPSDPSPE